VIKCRGGLCVPDPTRFRDPLLARTKALQHVREHIAAVGPLWEAARCRCRHEECTWHAPKSVTCAGPMTLVLIPDRVGRLWILAETCEACATATPRAKVIRSSRPPSERPGPAKAAAHATMPAAPLGEQRSDDRTPAAPRPSDRERAFNCEVCEAKAAPKPPVHEDNSFAAAQSEPTSWAVPGTYGDYALAALQYLHQAEVGHSPEARLLALLIALRVRPGGIVKMVSNDLGPGRMDLPDWALEELIDAEWVDASLDEVQGAVRGAPAAQLRVPDLAANSRPMGIPTGTARGKLNGWTQRMIDHPLLRGKPAADRLGAFFVTARCNREGRAQIVLRQMATLCRLTSQDLALEVMETLARAQWLAHVTPGPTSGHAVNVTLAHPIRHLAPGSPPPRTTPPAQPGPRPNPIKLRGREYEVAAWVDGYVARHRHGPRLHELIAAHCTENPRTPWPQQWMAGAVERLADEGWLHLDGNRWYRTRPGMAYLRQLAREQAAAAPAPQATEPRTPQQQTGSGQQTQPPGIWLIPGAEAVLGPRS
jgi:hypothetical protein